MEPGAVRWACPPPCGDGLDPDPPGTDSQYWSTAAVPDGAAQVFLDAADAAAGIRHSISARRTIRRVVEREA